MRDIGLKPRLVAEIRELARKHQIEKVILFGSRARGDHRNTSDIDLATTGGHAAGFALDVDESTSTLLKYDFVNLDGAVQKDLRDAIDREGIVLYEKV